MRGVPRVAGPLAGDHQDAQGCGAPTGLLGAARGTRPSAGAVRWLCSRYSMKALSMSPLSNRRSAVRRPLAPSSCRSAALLESVRSASTSPRASPGATTIPTRCSRTNAAGSPPATSTTGRPLAMASYSLEGVAPGMRVARGRGSWVGMKDARVHAVGEVIGAAGRKPPRDARHDRLRLAADHGRVAVAEPFQPRRETMPDAARSHHAEPHGGFGPEIGDIEDHRGTRPPAEPEPGDPEEERRALHDEILAAPQQKGAKNAG